MVVHRPRDLDLSRYATRRSRIPVTNPMLTLLNIAATLPAPMVEDALDRGLVARLHGYGGRATPS